MKFLFVLLVIYLVYAVAKSRFFRKKLEEKAAADPRPKRPDAEEVVYDAVCKTYIPISSSIAVRTEKGDFYFCSPACRDKFAGPGGDLL